MFWLLGRVRNLGGHLGGHSDESLFLCMSTTEITTCLDERITHMSIHLVSTAFFLHRTLDRSGGCRFMNSKKLFVGHQDGSRSVLLVRFVPRSQVDRCIRELHLLTLSNEAL